LKKKKLETEERRAGGRVGVLYIRKRLECNWVSLTIAGPIRHTPYY